MDKKIVFPLTVIERKTGRIIRERGRIIAKSSIHFNSKQLMKKFLLKLKKMPSLN